MKVTLKGHWCYPYDPVHITPPLCLSFIIFLYFFYHVKDFYELSLDLEDLVLPAIERESQGPRQAATLAPKRMSLLQKKLAVKNASMVKEIMGEDNAAGMGAMSFGGRGGLKAPVSETAVGAAAGAGPVRAQGGCPVAHTASTTSSSDSSAVSHQSTSPVSSHPSTHDAPAPSDMMSSQPFREKVPDALPEIQVHHTILLTNHTVAFLTLHFFLPFFQ